MPRIKSSFTLYSKKTKTQGTVWYFQTYAEDGRRLPGRSTGCRTRAEARRYCERLLKQGRLAAPRTPTLEQWVNERHWYEWDVSGPKCLYCKGRLARSTPEKPAIQRAYVSRCRLSLDRYILPHFGKLRLDMIRADSLEKWMFFLRNESALAAKSVINNSSAFRVIMAEAFRLGLIPDDPWKRVKMFTATVEKATGILTTEEALFLMNPATFDTIWSGHRLYYLANLTAMITAARSGEILALKKENLHPDHIDIFSSWNVENHELTPTKNKTRLPIPGYLYEELSGFAVWPAGYIFSFNRGKSPAQAKRILESLRKALVKIGISPEEADRRGLKFHSWRAFCNTYLRGRGLPDAKVRTLTRHQDEKMTDHYSHFSAEHFRDVTTEQDRLVSAIRAADVKLLAREGGENER